MRWPVGWRPARETLPRFKAERAQLRRERVERRASESVERERGCKIDQFGTVHFAAAQRLAQHGEGRVPTAASISAIGRMPAIGSFRERERHRHGPGKFSVYINWTPTHPLHDTRALERTAAQPRLE